MTDFKPSKNLEAVLRKIQSDIETVGWSVIGVLPDDKRAGFSYSVGLSQIGHPEIIVVGLPPDLARSLINGIRQDGVIVETGRKYDNIFKGLPAIFVEVTAVNREECLRAASLINTGGIFPALQLVWPDAKGVFPWEHGVDPSMVLAQQLLDRVDIGRDLHGKQALH